MAGLVLGDCVAASSLPRNLTKEQKSGYEDRQEGETNLPQLRFKIKLETVPKLCPTQSNFS